MSCRFFGLTGLFFAFCALPAPGQAEDQVSFEEAMRSRVEALRLDDRDASVLEIAAPRTVAEIHERHDFQPLWGGKADSVAQLLRQIAGSRDEGLDPEAYHQRQLQRMEVISPVSAARRVERELLLTDAMVRLGYHYRFGKVDPVTFDPNWNYSRRLNGMDPAAQILQAVLDGRVSEVLIAQLPDNSHYTGLRAALRRYRAIAQEGGWPQVPAGPAFRPGNRDPRTPVLRRRLEVTGDLAGAGRGDPEFVDDALIEAVRRFQRRHGLEPDGVAGKDTLRVMNVTAASRVEQIRVNMDRMRWVFHDAPSSFLLVDIAGFRARLVREGESVWESRAQVGRPFRMTPVFHAKMSYMVLNPHWTVPPRILDEDILPAVRRDVAYLERNDLRIMDGRGREVDARAIDWSGITSDNFRYLLRQAPGPKNALGRIKFMFPNRHMVYLHDTPSRELFGHSSRAFSSGCIRIEKPVDLAEILLRPDPGWDRDGILDALGSGETRTVVLPESMPVLLVYYTADTREDGTVRFRNDLYQRDEQVLRALNGRGSFTLPEDAPEWYRSDTLAGMATTR